MPYKTSADRYGSVAIALHWLTAALIAAAILVIWSFGYAEPHTPLKTDLLIIHRSLGLTVLAVAIVRLAWRVIHGAPPLDLGLPAWQRLIALVTHWAFYLLFFVQPITGYLSTAADNHEVSYFMLFDVPQMVPYDHALAEAMDGVHSALQWVIYTLIVLHTGAALAHHYLFKDGTLRRMLPSA
ncbi:MAG TPA: cytochrome b [Aliidongia sp.]|nr:cytochrome b [Aliidongia sp.]